MTKWEDRSELNALDAPETWRERAIDACGSSARTLALALTIHYHICTYVYMSTKTARVYVHESTYFCAKAKYK